MEENNDTALPIEEFMRKAAEGSKDAAQGFYELFLKTELVVPERYQQVPIGEKTTYPNDFVNILGIENDERTLVPIFSSFDAMKAWSGRDLEVKSITGASLLTLIPEGWTLVMNPGLEFEKEISPWEIDLLRGGTASIPAIVEELFQEEMIELLEVQALKDDEYPELKAKIIEEALLHEQVNRAFLIRESGKSVSGEIITSLLLGLEVRVDKDEEMDLIKDLFHKRLDTLLIGGDPFRILVGRDVATSLLLGVFKGSLPFYTSTRVAEKLPDSHGLFSRLGKFFGKD